ncbi:MAG: DUF1761 domain-containing protein [Candidatus Pacebacteria bacterium]|nr:DUF1761 domain-containing protein [Candidatus Paceibacterota bacterium]
MPTYNLWITAVSMILSVVLGFLWYGPLFGKQWMELSGIKMPEGKPSLRVMIKPIVLSLVGSFVLVFGLASVTAFHNAYWHVTGYATGLSFAVFLWLAFIVPPYLNFTGWEGKPWKLFFINSGYWLVYLLLVSVLLTTFG